MKGFRIFLILAASVIIIAQLTWLFGVTDKSTGQQWGSYLSILSMILLIVAMLASIRDDRTSN